MNRAPATGDVVTMDKKEVVVVSVAGSWPCNVRTIKRSDLGKQNPKTTDHLVHMMNVPGAIYLANITFHEQIKLKVNTTYTEK